MTNDHVIQGEAKIWIVIFERGVDSRHYPAALDIEEIDELRNQFLASTDAAHEVRPVEDGGVDASRVDARSARADSALVGLEEAVRPEQLLHGLTSQLKLM